MKKKLKVILLIIIGPIVLGIMANLAFKAIEFTTGGKFVSYLEDHSETVTIDEPFSYSIADDDIQKSKLILVGEAHGVKEPTKFDVHFFKHLYTNHGVRTYFAEMDCSQAFLLNEFMKNGDESMINEILKNWVVAQGRNNKDYYGKYAAFQEFYAQLPENEKFRFLGIDKIRDWGLVASVLNRISSADSSLDPLVFENKIILSQLKERINVLDSIYQSDAELSLFIDQLQKNIGYYQDTIPREEVMFKNFERYYKYYGLENSKSYGFFGLYHIFQYRIDDELPLAGLIRESDLGLESSMLSFNFMFVDSHMVMKSNALPSFLQDDGPYTKMGITSDNPLVIYIYGIMDFKRMTGENEKSLIKMNGAENPYAESKRLNTVIQLLPVTDIFKMTEKGKEYVQYTIFVRNSDWAEPIME